MSYRNDRFNRRMLSSDQTSIDPAKDRSRSDGGRGVERMVDVIDYTPELEDAEDAKEKAIQASSEGRLVEVLLRLVEARKEHLIPTLLYIINFGSDRDESISHMTKKDEKPRTARRRYERHRDALSEFFDVA